MERLNKFENPQIEKTCGQLAISAGLRFLSKFEKELGHRYEPMVLPVPGESSPDDNDNSQPTVESLHTLHLLNWLALFLAQSNHDSTAVSIVKMDNAIVFYVSINKDTADTSYRQRAESLLECVYNVITHHVTGASARQGETGTQINGLIHTLVEKCWPKISQRLEELKVAITKAGGSESVVKIWPKGHRYQEPPNTDSKLKSSPIKCLQDQLTTLNTMNVPGLTEGTVETRFECLMQALESCKVLVDQHSVPKSDDNDWFKNLGDATYITLDQIYHHVRSVYDYYFTTSEFLAGGVNLLCKHIGTPNSKDKLREHMKILWVRDLPQFCIGSTCKWDLSPKEWIDGIIDDYSVTKPTLISPPRDKVHQLTLTTSCASLWTKGDPISARIHPGIELLYYLEDKNLATVCDVIGTSSELCCACGIYFEKLRDKQLRKRWLTRSRCTNMIETNWLLPPTNNRHHVGKNKWARFTALQTGAHIRKRTASSIDAYLKKNRE